jgi:phosphinothricin acetyltransferase
MNSSRSLRLATEADLVAINEIYNYYVPRSTCTYQEELNPLESRRRWLEQHDTLKHPAIVVTENRRVIGWGALSPFHTRSAYQHSVENSIYIDHAYHGQGVGSMILADLIERARAAHHHAIIALIDSEQSPSVAIHSKFGFTEVGHLKEVGFKFGRWLDVIYMQLLLH